MNLPSSSGHKFKVGDRVRCDGYGYAEVLKLINFVPGLHACPMYELLMESNNKPMVLEQVWLQFIMPKEEPKCECGAHHTSKPNTHLNFCPLAIIKKV